MTNKDIHKWTDGRYTLMFDEHTFFVWDNEKDERMCALEVTEKLNEQQATINKQEKLIKRKDITIATLTENIEKLGDDSKMLELLHKEQDKVKEQQDTIEQKNEYQRTLEAKIRRLKDRIKVLEK